MHIGLTPWALRSGSASVLTEQAVLAESLGYDSFFLPENHFNDGALPDPLMLLAAVSSATRTIGLGTTSYLLPVRHPLQAAEQVAVLDQLCEGRLILGLGRGFSADLFTAFGVRSKDKRQIFTESLALMRRAWAGEAVAIGDAEPVEVHPKPVQQPGPELWVAAFGPKALAQVAALNLPYLASPMETLDVLAENYATIREAAGQLIGVPVMRSVYCSRRESDLSRVREAMAAIPLPRQGEDVQLDDWAIIGTPEQVSERVAEYEQRLGMTHLIATRLRLPGLSQDELVASVELTAQTLISQ